MRKLILILAIVPVVGCGDGGLADYAPADEDASIFKVVLQDLAKQDLGSYPDGNTLYVSTRSNGRGGPSEDQIESDCRDRVLPGGIIKSIRAENSSEQRIPAQLLRAPSVRSGDYEPVGGYEFDESDYPRARAILNFYLPGYSDDRQYAMVRFWLSPTSHGASGTYLLRRTGDSWVVEWFELSYYL